jgi:hypothetical protein
MREQDPAIPSGEVSLCLLAEVVIKPKASFKRIEHQLAGLVLLPTPEPGTFRRVGLRTLMVMTYTEELSSWEKETSVFEMFEGSRMEELVLV